MWASYNPSKLMIAGWQKGGWLKKVAALFVLVPSAPHLLVEIFNAMYSPPFRDVSLNNQKWFKREKLIIKNS